MILTIILSILTFVIGLLIGLMIGYYRIVEWTRNHPDSVYYKYITREIDHIGWKRKEH